ncbi:hypothetical protein ACHAXA_010780 [Cyclostephanos tholiformis]|uniref:Uncharacterized protein n=1 Tax=Cyclostephanos tholiformis TaxID=382380 RepID=A0ABD3RST8_9STRA
MAQKAGGMAHAAIARLTVGCAQIIAVSATISRPLQRELSCMLGLQSSECPKMLQGEDNDAKLGRMMVGNERHVGRAVKIPDAIQNSILPMDVDGLTAGSLLTVAAFASKAILKSRGHKVLLVLTRNCDIKVHNALGALHHFRMRPEPQLLLDVLEANGIELVEAHCRVSRVEGVGGMRDRNGKRGLNILGGKNEGYLLVRHKDNVSGLHLDGLDAVIIIGRPGSLDEYTHIAGCIGRVGQ